MEGNVLEWTCEFKRDYQGGHRSLHWQPYFPFRSGAWNDWLAARGGAFNMGAEACEPTLRRAINIFSRCAHIGFRLARGPALPPWIEGNLSTFIFHRAYIEKAKAYQAIMSAQAARTP